ncbi:MAG: VOC family protein [Rhodoplanes sp.]|uniref:VOC family protein n=1 Tax=Rhodoplanes sp. TaxID=1968906 RepID=UPI0017F0A637|nr:VOC family protein [Rhodoplanes sp.]NVO17892.1 VOC family protein [Rhodoplanes sp.]
MAVTQLLGISITVADLATAAFYRDRLGLEIGPEHTVSDPAWNTLLGLTPRTTARAIDVAIGPMTVELVAFDPPGLAYPAERASTDLWFEHCALVCRDIAAARERLAGGSFGAITDGGPVLLPPNTGRVSAFKFRDPEGHPLELITFPEGVGAAVWHQSPGPGILGYDHTAISVLDVDRSIAFYSGLLGFSIGGRSLNQGPEQDRLDGLTGCAVDVVALEPASVATPHVELLHYRTPLGRVAAAEVRSNDVAAVRQVHAVDDLDAIVRRLERAGVRFVSPGVVTSQSGRRAAVVRDPDEHAIMLVAQGEAEAERAKP